MLGVPDQPAGEAAGHLPLELGMILGVPLPTVGTLEAALQPHQRGGPTQRQVLDQHPAGLMDPGGPVTTERAAYHLAGIGHLHHQPVDLILDDPHHPQPPQMQPHRHLIARHQNLLHRRYRRRMERSPLRAEDPHPMAPTDIPTDRAVGGHEILPSGGHVAARWRPTELPRGGHLFCPR